MHKNTILYLLLFFSITSFTQNTFTAEYSGNIPSNYDSYDYSCNGPSTVITTTMPAGEAYYIDSVVVFYDFIAINNGWKSDQRSKIGVLKENGFYFEENQDAVGIGTTGGNQNYTRTIYLANGPIAGGEKLEFQLWALRTYTNNQPLCSDTENYIGFWSVTVHYSNEVISAKVGINKSNPKQTLDISGKLKIADDTNIAQNGNVRWNPTTHDFEAYVNNDWTSMTKKSIGHEWGNNNISENDIESDTAFFGYGVDINDEFTFVSSPNSSPNNLPSQGKVFVYKNNSIQLLPHSTIVANNPQINDAFGSAIAANNDYLAISKRNLYFNQIGKIEIHKRVGDTWIYSEELASNLPSSNQDFFGSAMDITENYLICGARGYDNFTGSALIFKRNGTTWVQQAVLSPDVTSGIAQYYFGGYVSISDSFAVVGEINTDMSPRVYFYKNNGSNWSLDTIIYPPIDQAPFISPFPSISSLTLEKNELLLGFSDNSVLSSFILSYKKSGGSWTRQPDISSPISGTGIGYNIDGDNHGNIIIGNGSQHTFIFKKENDLWHNVCTMNTGTGTNVGRTSIYKNRAITSFPFNSYTTGKIHFYIK